MAAGCLHAGTDQRKKTFQDANRLGWLNVSLVIDDRQNSSHPFLEWSVTLDDQFSRAELNAAARIARIGVINTKQKSALSFL